MARVGAGSSIGQLPKRGRPTNFLIGLSSLSARNARRGCYCLDSRFWRNYRPRFADKTEPGPVRDFVLRAKHLCRERAQSQIC